MTATWAPPAATPGLGPENLPYGAIRRDGGPSRLAVRIGDHALDLGAAACRSTSSTAIRST